MSSDGFFTSAGQPSTNYPTNQHTVASFAHAITPRFASSDLLTARLPDKPQSISIPNQHSHPAFSLPSPSNPSPPLPFTPVTPHDLPSYLSDPTTLILDIRPHAAHTAARIHRAISLSIPSTLLKRPNFGLSKLLQMLPSSSARSRFGAWPSANQILVYDADSLSIPDSSNIAGLLRKFRAEGFAGSLAWLKGGFQAVWRDARHCTTTDHPSPDEDDPDGSTSGALRTKHLPKAAFSLSTTAAGAASGTPSFLNAANPFFDTIRQNVELSHGITERIPLRLPRHVRRRINDLPFRWLQDIARRSAVRPHHSSCCIESSSENSDDPHESDPDSNDPDIEEGAETLAMQFYRIELAEQRRLRTVMEHHAKESEVSAYAAAGQPYTLSEGGQGIVAAGARPGAKSAPPTPHQGAFPFSITAGVEKGAKNRYNHIWPFEHARVRLHDGRHQGSHPGPKRDKKKDSVTGENTSTAPGSPTFASTSASEDRDQNQDTHMNVDRLPIRTPTFLPTTPFQSQSVYHTPAITTPFNGPPSARGGVPITPFRSLPRATSGGDTYFPTMLPFQPVPEISTISPIPEESPINSPPTRPAVQVRTGGFLSPPLLSGMPKPSSPLSAVPKASSPLAQSSFLPSQPGFNLTLPSMGQVRAPQQFNLAVIPPANMGDDCRMPSPVDDYVNASYVQPLGTRKRYIATQGPLPATFVDFWTLVWEQNVHVIVMLTREVENAMVKCGTYWTELSYGPLQLQLLSTSPPISPSASHASTDAGFFSAMRESDRGSKQQQQQPSTIVRTFALSHRGYPGVPPRRVTHLQYLDWPDMNVPEDPRGILELVGRVERAVQESTPGPSPSGSHSNSGTGSLSPGSPGRTLELMGRGEEFFSSPPLGEGGSRRKSGRRGWRHPELDAKTGVAAFALGCTPPVLLHCSAGVGRTGGFIAVDAVLDAIRREITQRREHRARVRPGVEPAKKVDENAIGQKGGESGTESGGMGVDAHKRGGIRDTVPLVIGDRKKSRHHAHKGAQKDETSSSESLVVHVPVASPPRDVAGGEQTKDMVPTDLDMRWPSSSTREWAEQVLDQTHPGEGALSRSMSLSTLAAPSRERSPGSTSSSSGPSALNSADDSVGSGSGTGDKAGSGRSVSLRSSSGSGLSGKANGSGGPPPSSSVTTSHSGSGSHSGPGSISASNSGSGTNTSSNSGLWNTESSGFAGLMRARLRDDSSATSLSNIGSDYSSDKRQIPLRKSMVVHINSENEDAMDVDCPVPPQEGKSGGIAAPRNAPVIGSNLRPRTHYMVGSSPVTSFSTPVLPTMTAAGRASDDPFFQDGEPVSRASPNPSSDDLRGFESGASADVETVSGKSSQASPDDSEDNMATSEKAKSELKVEVASAISAALVQEKTPKLSSAPIQTEFTKRKDDEVKGGAVPSSVLPTPGLHEHKTHQVELGPSEMDQRAAGHAVIDYKLPRQLHQDLSPAPLMSHTNPIWTVVQDMREQRMSLCQSLRQYVFVHAAVIEGALMIMDEEREVWGDSAWSEEGHEPLEDNGRKSDESDVRLTPLKDARSREISGMERQGTRDRTCSFPPAGGRRSTSNSNHVSQTTTSTSPAAPSSPSKWKRGPSPTELLKEDKLGAVSTAKRPSINRRTSSSDQILTASSGAPHALSSSGGKRVSNLVGGNMTNLRTGPMAPGQDDPFAAVK